MKQQIFGIMLCAVVMAHCVTADAQPAKTFKIGYLSAQADQPERRGGAREVVRRELHTLGYVEGKNIVFEYRFADNKLERLSNLAGELVGVKIDSLFASSNSAALAAKKATRTIPIVFLGGGDPVALGLVDSLARPGGNMTGITSIQETLSGKRLEILKETVSKLSRVAVLWNPRAAESVQQWKESQLSARELGLQLHSMEASSAARLDNVFNEAIKAHSTALAGTHQSLFTTNRKQIVELAAKYRLPAIFTREDYVDSGGLMSYGSDRAEPYNRAAVMIDKILKAQDPPISQSSNRPSSS